MVHEHTYDPRMGELQQYNGIAPLWRMYSITKVSLQCTDRWIARKWNVSAGSPAPHRLICITFCRGKCQHAKDNSCLYTRSSDHLSTSLHEEEVIVHLNFLDKELRQETQRAGWQNRSAAAWAACSVRSAYSVSQGIWVLAGANESKDKNDLVEHPEYESK